MAKRDHPLPSYDNKDFDTWCVSFAVALRNDLDALITGSESFPKERPSQPSDDQLSDEELLDLQTFHSERYAKQNKKLFQQLYAVAKRSDKAGLSIVTGVNSIFVTTSDGVGAWIALRRFHKNLRFKSNLRPFPPHFAKAGAERESS